MVKLVNQNKEYLSSKDAGALLGYTHDYISRLCRQGKMSGIQKGREWFVTQEELDLFKGRHELELQEKKKELSKKFSKIRTEAEAKKRKARQASDTGTYSQGTSSVYVGKKSLKFIMPRQIVALGVLAFLLVAPTIFDSLNKPSIFNEVSISEESFSFDNITSSYEDAIEDTIYAQATVVEPVAAVFGFMSYLDDGYRQFFIEISRLPGATYQSLVSIGNFFLVLYVLQGEALYYSMQDLNTMGSFVLRGYELIGESFWFGSEDILNRYMRLFSIDSSIDVGKNQINSFSDETQGGFVYMVESVNHVVSFLFLNKMGTVFSSLVTNVQTNTFAIQSTFADVSRGTSAYIGSLFEFDLVKKQERIRAIKIEK